MSSMAYLAGISAGADAVAAHVVATAVAHEARPRLYVGVTVEMYLGRVKNHEARLQLSAATPVHA